MFTLDELMDLLKSVTVPDYDFKIVSEEPRSNVRYNFRCSYVADFAQRLIYLSPDVQSQTYVKNYPNITNIFSSKDILYFQQCIEKREIF